jgi:hypothetical protein
MTTVSFFLVLWIWIQKQGNGPKSTNKHEFQPFKKAFVPMFYDLQFLHKVHFSDPEARKLTKINK